MSTYIKDTVERFGHTAWQAGGAYLLANSQDWETQATLIATAAVAAVFSFLKSLLARNVGTKGTAALGGGL